MYGRTFESQRRDGKEKGNAKMENQIKIISDRELSGFRFVQAIQTADGHYRARVVALELNRNGEHVWATQSQSFPYTKGPTGKAKAKGWADCMYEVLTGACDTVATPVTQRPIYGKCGACGRVYVSRNDANGHRCSAE